MSAITGVRHQLGRLASVLPSPATAGSISASARSAGTPSRSPEAPRARSPSS